MIFRLSFIDIQKIFILLILSLAVLSIALRNEVLIASWSAVIFVYILFGVFQLSLDTGRSTVLYLITLILTSFCLPYAVLNDTAAVFHYYISVSALTAAYIMRRSLLSLLCAVRAVLYVFQFLVVYYLFRNGFDGFPLENIIPGSSSNGVTSYMIILQAAFSSLNYIVYRRADIFPALLTVIICFVGYGRGSVIASSLILFINIFYCLLSSKKLFYFSMFVLLIGLIFSAGRLESEILDFVNSKTKIGSGIYDSNRMEMHSDYLSKIDGVTFFTGASYEGTSIDSKYNGNPHSSYIRAHHIFGILFLFGVCFSLVFVSFSNVAISLRVYVLSMIAVIMLRAATEPILFPSFLDVLYYCIVFSFLEFSEGRGSNESS